MLMHVHTTPMLAKTIVNGDAYGHFAYSGRRASAETAARKPKSRCRNATSAHSVRSRVHLNAIFAVDCSQGGSGSCNGSGGDADGSSYIGDVMWWQRNGSDDSNAVGVGNGVAVSTTMVSYAGMEW